MKNRLLFSTALVAVLSATNVYAADLSGKVERPDNINIGSSTEYTIDNAYSEQSGDLDEGILYTSTVNVDKGGKLTVSSSDIVADGSGDAVTLKGTVILDGTSIMAGNKYPDAKQNMIIDGADITFNTTSDLLSATGDLKVSNASINLGNITIDNSKIDMSDLMIVSGLDSQDGAGEPLGEGNITVSGNSDIKVKEIGVYGKGDININGGNITAQDIGAEQGNITISNGSVNVIEGGEGLYARDTLNIKGGTVNMSGNGNRIWGTNIAMSGGTLNIEDSTTFETQNPVDISGGTVNIAENSSLGWASVDEDSDIDLRSGAILNLAGTLNANIESPGTINIQNSNSKIAGSVEISNGGVMNVGLNKATIGGDITFDAGSTLNMSVTDEGNGLLSARNIHADEGSKLALTISKTMEIGDSDNITLFETTGKFDNNFTNEISNNRYKITSIDGGTYNIKNSTSDVVNDAGGTSSNASTAEAWDGMKNNTSASATAQDVASKLNDLSQNDSKAYVDALTAVAPEVAPMVQKTQSETANQVFGAVSTRLTGGSVSTGGEGMSSGDNIFERAAMWVQGLFNHSKLDDTSKAYGFDADSSGVAMGAEKYVTEDTKIGLGYAYTNTDIDGFMRSTDVDTHTAFVYGEYKPSNWYVNGIVSYGWSDYSEDKNVSGVGVKADYDAETFGLQAMTGYDMQLKHFGLTPEVGLRYVHISQDGYTDSADQKVSSSDSDILTGVIGAKVSKTWTLENGMNIKPEARIAATYDLMNDDVNSVVTLANGSAYMVEGDALDRFGMEFGAGVTAEVNDNVEFALGYEGKFREDYQDHTGLVNLKYKF